MALARSGVLDVAEARCAGRNRSTFERSGALPPCARFHDALPMGARCCRGRKSCDWVRLAFVCHLALDLQEAEPQACICCHGCQNAQPAAGAFAHASDARAHGGCAGVRRAHSRCTSSCSCHRSQQAPGSAARAAATVVLWRCGRCSAEPSGCGAGIQGARVVVWHSRGCACAVETAARAAAAAAATARTWRFDDAGGGAHVPHLPAAAHQHGCCCALGHRLLLPVLALRAGCHRPVPCHGRACWRGPSAPAVRSRGVACDRAVVCS